MNWKSGIYILSHEYTNVDFPYGFIRVSVAKKMLATKTLKHKKSDSPKLLRRRINP
jgi:hypothetical protein